MRNRIDKGPRIALGFNFRACCRKFSLILFLGRGVVLFRLLRHVIITYIDFIFISTWNVKSYTKLNVNYMMINRGGVFNYSQ